jgi:uncharacterized membrane protein YfcA
MLGALSDLLVGRYRRMAATRARIGVIYAVAGVFIFITLVALLAAGSIVLASQVGPLVASLLVALFSCLIALILLLVAVSQRKRAEKREAEDAAAQRQAMLLLVAGLPVLRNRTTLIMAVVVGLLAGLVTAPGKDDPEA